MSHRVASRETAEYLDAIGPQLVHLADDEREELLDELAIHLDSVLEVADAAGDDRDLIALLGPPERFVRDYCESAGIGLSPASVEVAPGPLSAFGRRVGRAFAWLEARLLGRNALRDVIAFFPELRPAWWVLRAVLAVMIAGQILGGDGVDRWWIVPVPKLFDHVAVGLLASWWAVRMSVRLGREQRRRTRRTTLVNTIIAVAGMAVLSTGFAAAAAWTGSAVHSTEPAIYVDDGGVELTAADGRPSPTSFLTTPKAGPSRASDFMTSWAAPSTTCWPPSRAGPRTTPRSPGLRRLNQPTPSPARTWTRAPGRPSHRRSSQT